VKLKTLTLSAATAALLATGAYAQDTTQPATPATPPVATPDQPAANKPMTDSESQMPNAAADKSADTAASTKTTTESIQFTSSAGSDDLMASELIGTPVRNSKDDKLGDINDVIMGKDGKPTVAVLGVGGFLGIGEKNVGIPFDSLQFTTDNNKKIARLEVEKQALESAPAFVYPEKPAATSTGMSSNTGNTRPPAPAQ
jgi:hypothetical protein